MISLGDDDSELDCLTDALRRKYSLKVSPEVTHFLGIEIVRSASGIYLGQESYALQILEKFAPSNLEPSPTLKSISMEKSESSPLDEEGHTWFRGALGSLMYLSTTTRPDLSFMTSHLGRFASKPLDDHRKMMLNLLSYLKATASFGLFYRFQSGELQGKLSDHVEYYSDADYAADQITRRSRSGVHIRLFGTVQWKSKLHSVISLSTMEAELYGAVDCVREALLTRIILWELMNFKQYPGEDIEKLDQIKLHVDNSATIARSLPGENIESTKHIQVRRLWIQKMVNDGDLLMTYIRTAKNPADLQTKAITGDKLRTHAGMEDLKDKYNLMMDVTDASQQTRENVGGYATKSVYLLDWLCNYQL